MSDQPLTLTDTQLTELLEMEAKATPGPWKSNLQYIAAPPELTDGRLTIVGKFQGRGSSTENEANSALTEALRNAARPLIEEVQRRRAEVAKLIDDTDFHARQAAELRDDVARLTDKLAACAADNEKWRAAVTARNGEVARLTEENAALRTSLQTSHEEFDDWWDDVAKSNPVARYNPALAAWDAQTERVADAVRQAAAKAKENAELKRRVEAAEGKLYEHREIWAEECDDATRMRAQSDADKYGVPVWINVFGVTAWKCRPVETTHLRVKLAASEASEKAARETIKDLEHDRDIHKKVLWAALQNVDRIFQDASGQPPPLLPDFLKVGEDKFVGCVKLAEEFIALRSRLAAAERQVASYEINPPPSVGSAAWWAKRREDEAKPSPEATPPAPAKDVPTCNDCGAALTTEHARSVLLCHACETSTVDDRNGIIEPGDDNAPESGENVILDAEQSKAFRALLPPSPDREKQAEMAFQTWFRDTCFDHSKAWCDRDSARLSWDHQQAVIDAKDADHEVHIAKLNRQLAEQNNKLLNCNTERHAMRDQRDAAIRARDDARDECKRWRGSYKADLAARDKTIAELQSKYDAAVQERDAQLAWAGELRAELERLRGEK